MGADTLYFVLVVMGFLAIVLFVEGSFLAWNSYRGPEAKRVERRLRAMSAGNTAAVTILLKKRMLSSVPLVDRLLLQLPRVHSVDRLLEQSGSNMTVGNLLGLSVLLALVTLVGLVLLSFNVLIALGLALVVASLPLLHVVSKRRERMLRIEEQLPDALDLITRAVRAGHAFPSALQMLGNEGPEPVASEFRTTFDEINFGVSMQDALTNLATRVPSTDIRYFVIAVLIQRDTGGNLTELLGNIASLIRARLKLKGTIRVLSAEGRLSAWILSLLPFVLAGVLHAINPEFLSALWKDPMGIKMLITAMFLMVFGIFWMWRIIKIRI